MWWSLGFAEIPLGPDGGLMGRKDRSKEAGWRLWINPGMKPPRQNCDSDDNSGPGREWNGWGAPSWIVPGQDCWPLEIPGFGLPCIVAVGNHSELRKPCLPKLRALGYRAHYYWLSCTQECGGWKQGCGFKSWLCHHLLSQSSPLVTHIWQITEGPFHLGAAPSLAEAEAQGLSHSWHPSVRLVSETDVYFFWKTTRPMHSLSWSTKLWVHSL